MANTKVTGDLIANSTVTATNLADSAVTTDKLANSSVTAAKLSSITTDNISEGTNLFYTDARVGTYLSGNGYDTATNIIATITDSAPTTLDTLNELAAALGDDPNFATTVTNSIAAKLPLAGGTLTGDLIVNANVGIGMTPAKTLDLQNTDNLAIRLYNGASFKAGIEVATTAGDMVASSAIDDLGIRSQSNILFATGGNTERLRIDSSGNVGIGTSSPQALLHLDTGSVLPDLKILISEAGANAMSFFYEGSAGSGTNNKFHIRSEIAGQLSNLVTVKLNGDIGIGETAPSAKLHIKTSSNDNLDQVLIESTADGAATNPDIAFYTNSATPANNDNLGALWFYGKNSASQQVAYGTIHGTIINVADGSESGALNFYTNVGGSGGVRMSLIEDRLYIGDTFLSGESFAKLHVDGTNTTVLITEDSEGVASLRLADTQATSSQAMAINYNTANGDFYFYRNQSDIQFLINSSGNVGIGKVPTHKLSLHNSSTLTPTYQSFTNGTATSGTVIGIDSDGDFVIINQENKDQKFFTNDTERMRIDASGNVGIGTTPVGTRSPLHIHKSSGATYIHMTNNDIGATENNGTSLIENTNGDFLIRNRENANTLFYTNNLERMRIAGDGKVSIMPAGLSNGSLTVGRNGNFSSLGPVSDGNGTTTAFLSGYSSASGTSNAIIYTNGTYGSRTGTYGAIISDERYKENIVDTSPKLDKIMQVKVRNFNLIGDDLKQIGVIAQEVEKIFPSLVYEREVIDNIGTVDEEGNVTSEIKQTGETAKAVKDSIFTYILLKSVQELKEIVDNQQQQINDLKAQLNG